MFNLWLLLLLVAPIKAYPAYEIDYLEDAEETTWSILKDTLGKLKDLYTKKGKEAWEKLTGVLSEKLCSQQDFDFEEDEEPSLQTKILQNLKELLKKLQEAKDAEKAKIQNQINDLMSIICGKLNDIEDETVFGELFVEEDSGDDVDKEGIEWGKIGEKISQQITQTVGNVMLKGTKIAWKIMKPGLKLAGKAGKALIKKYAVVATSLECKGLTCKTCVKLTKLGMSACTKATISSEKRTVYFTVVGELNSLSVFQDKIMLGEIPKCVNAGSFIGNVCLKGIEGKNKYNKEETQVNFCLGFLAERYSFGLKVCASYENNQFSVKIEPELFAGGLDDDGDIIVVNDEDENLGAVLGAEEFD